MQTTTTHFDDVANSHYRKFSWQVKASFDKALDPSINFFTLDVSVLDGPDILGTPDSSIINEWDKYDYKDYSDRIISVEVNREVVEPYSVAQAYADITFKNDDNYFTPNSGSPIDSYILPRRPFRISMGFDGENLPQMVGLSEKMPTIDKKAGTVTFHIIDFLTFIFDKEIDQVVLLQDSSTGDILSYLFQLVGLAPNQFVIDDTSFNTVKYFYANKGDKLGKIVRELMRDEQGTLYMDELGVIRFINRQNYSTAVVDSFDKENVIDYSTSDQDDIINSVKINVNLIDEAPEQPIFDSTRTEYIKSGESIEVWASFSDPVTSVTNPVYSEEETTTSSFSAYEDPYREFPYGSISLDSITKFSKAVLMVFENTGSTNAYITNIQLWGTPIREIDTIIVEEKDQASIDSIEEYLYEYDSKYIQDVDNAISKAVIMVDDYKDLGSVVDFDAKANPARQILDLVDLDLDGFTGNHVITSITNVMDSARFSQKITAKSKQMRQYFILDVSVLDGTDVLAP